MVSVLATGIVVVDYDQNIDMVKLLRHTRITNVAQTAGNPENTQKMATSALTAPPYGLHMHCPAQGRLPHHSQ